jgi:hypothetical protein
MQRLQGRQSIVWREQVADPVDVDRELQHAADLRGRQSIVGRQVGDGPQQRV